MPIHSSVRPPVPARRSAATVSPAPSRRGVLAVGSAGVLGLALAACGGSSGGAAGEDDLPTVVTTCYPLSYIARRVGQDQVEIVDLATPGVDPHGLELSVAEVSQMEAADVVLQIPGFQTAVDDAITSQGLENVLDISGVIAMLGTSDEDAHHEEHEDPADDDHVHAEDADGDHSDHDHGEFDPHFWHDPLRMADVGDALAEHLAEHHPDQAEMFTEHAAQLREELEQLDQDLAEQYGAVDGERTFVTSHTAFAYLADRYDLQQIGISGIDPEVEPSPQRLLELERIISEQGVSTIFFESTASPKVAETLATRAGVRSEELDNLETQVSEDTDYPAVMRENAATLVASW
ncbi:MAG: metal ABC transporter substrate-binding protein [Brachybacterium sp.]|nr:metal ABC transporter substrate-binding protein [Brachybacterium sp.]